MSKKIITKSAVAVGLSTTAATAAALYKTRGYNEHGSSVELNSKNAAIMAGVSVGAGVAAAAITSGIQALARKFGKKKELPATAEVGAVEVAQPAE